MQTTRRLLFILNFLFVMALGAAVVMVYMPQSLADIDRTTEGSPVDRDLLSQVNQAILSGNSFKCSEKDLNDHLHLVMHAREADGFEIFSEFKNILVRLNDGSMEIIFERDVLGWQSTVSAILSIEVHIEGASKTAALQVVGGRFGSLPVTKNFVGLIRKALVNVGNGLVPEKEVLSRLEGITIQNGWLILEAHAGSKLP